MNKDVQEAALKLLNFRSYSQYELQQKLLKQGYDAPAVQQAVNYVMERGYLNDAALCDMLLSQYAAAKRYSLRETYVRLRRRGLAPALITDRLANRDDSHEYEAALKLAQTYWRAGDSQITGKIVRRLAAKGFKAATVNKVLEYLRDMLP